MGGCIFANIGGLNIDIDNTIFENNYCESDNDSNGAAIYLLCGDGNENSNLILSNCKFLSNFSSNKSANGQADGGAIFLMQYSIECYDCIFENNSASNGGAMYIMQSSKFDANIKNCLMHENKSNNYGNAIYLDSTPKLNLQGTEISGNSGGFGAICTDNINSHHGIFETIITGSPTIKNNYTNYDNANKLKNSNLVLVKRNEDLDRVAFDENSELSAENRIGFNLVDVNGNDCLGTLTEGYNYLSPEHDPYKYFTYEGYAGAAIIGDDGEQQNEIIIAEHEHD